MLDEAGRTVVTVKKDELLAAVRRNREQHAREYATARDGFLAELSVRLAKAVQLAADGIDAREELQKLQAPESHVGDYDRAIRMLEMSVAAETRLSEQMFRHYVMDEWSWMEHFKAVSSSYTPPQGRR